MIYVKSTLVGLLALLLSAIIYVVVVVIRIARSVPAGAGMVSVDVMVFVRSPLFWTVTILSGAGAFFWILRRSSAYPARFHSRFFGVDRGTRRSPFCNGLRWQGQVGDDGAVGVVIRIRGPRPSPTKGLLLRPRPIR
jgi:hypothetical protein